MNWKNTLLFLILILSFFTFLNRTYASDKVEIIGDSVRLRSEPTTNSKIITTLNTGYEGEFIKEEKEGNGCSDKWLQIKYVNTIGYVCSTYAKIVKEVVINKDDYKEYSDYLKALGFPDTYIDSLVKLHVSHPNWQFRPYKVDLSFNDIINFEYLSTGRSLIEDTGNYIDGYKSTDSWSYDYFTNTFNNKYVGGGTYWFAANKDTIGYYVDPRNFLNDSQIFMFELLSFNSNYHTIDGINMMLKGTFMENNLADKVNNKTYADAFMDASLKYQISPYVLISRVIQEVGAKGSTIVSGTYSGYEGYYNFYNIKAYGSNSAETISNGLKYAKENGWDNQYKAIVGGASFLSEGYINKGQDTVYLQKWDVNGKGSKQYMQNIQAPASESIKTYKGYKDLNLIDSSFVFKIPVYVNMPIKTTLPNKGNPNNYLKKLSVNGSYLFDKPSNTLEYNLNLSSSTNSIEITAEKVYYKSIISGTGSVIIKSDKQTIPIKVTSESGVVRTYNINITRDKEEAISISELLNIANIKNDGTYIYGIELGADISKIITLIKDKEPKVDIKVTNRNNQDKNVGIISSGDKIKLTTNKETKEFTIIIYGDVNSDGKITSADYIMIKNHIMDIVKFNQLELIYGDANKDGKITSADYIAIKNHIMNDKKIVQ